MTTRRDLKSLVRARMAKTGESYATARRQLMARQESRGAGDRLSTPSPQWNPLIQTTKAEAAVLLEKALGKEPRLTHFGIGVYDELRRRRDARRNVGDDVEIDRELERGRAALWSHLDEIAASADWIRLQRRIATHNNRQTSYGYKHAVERWFRARDSYQYVANGSFIAAALGLGFQPKPASFDSPNVLFPFSNRTVKALEVVGR